MTEFTDNTETTAAPTLDHLIRDGKLMSLPSEFKMGALDGSYMMILKSAGREKKWNANGGTLICCDEHGQFFIGQGENIIETVRHAGFANDPSIEIPQGIPTDPMLQRQWKKIVLGEPGPVRFDRVVIEESGHPHSGKEAEVITELKEGTGTFLRVALYDGPRTTFNIRSDDVRKI